MFLEPYNKRWTVGLCRFIGKQYKVINIQLLAFRDKGSGGKNHLKANGQMVSAQLKAITIKLNSLLCILLLSIY